MTRCGRPYRLFIFILLSVLTFADARGAAPRFTASTLSGETFTNDSIRGQVALLQFWKTWCPYCLGEQPVLDGIAREFSREGLVVLAVNVQESGDTVKKFLEEHPRSCPVVLTENTNLVAEFNPRSFPFYVLIDREGNVAGTQNGAGGDSTIRNLLGRAGLGVSSANATRSRDQHSPVTKGAYPSSAKLIEVPRGRSAPPAKPQPPTVFVLKTGEKLETHHYTIMAGSLNIPAGGDQRTIPLSDLDLKATLAANHARGIDLKIPTNPSQISLGF